MPASTKSEASNEEIIENGTTLDAFEASSASVELDSNPEMTQTGVKKPRHHAQTLFVQ